MVGTFPYQCERKDYYSIKTPGTTAKIISTVQKQLPEYQQIINIREDAAWDAYLTFLYPNEETMEYMNNGKVLTTLKEAGDKLEKERPVDHQLYLPDT